VLHVTDLHAEGDYRPTSDTNVRWWIEAIKDLARGKPFDVVACAGDIGHSGKPDSIKTGWQLLAEVRRVANAKVVPLIISPGNHDAGRQPYDSDSNWEFKNRFKAYLDTVYRDSTSAPYGPLGFQDDQEKQLWVSANKEIEILPISSANLSGALEQSTNDEVDVLLEQLQEHSNEEFHPVFKDDAGVHKRIPVRRLIERIKRYRLAEMPVASGELGLHRQEALLRGKPAMLRIALIHHPLWSVTKKDPPNDPLQVTVDGMSTVQWLQEKGFQLVLHGHKHFLGCCLLKGHLGCDDKEPHDLFETVALSGGCVGDKVPGAGELGFQFLDFWFDAADCRAEVIVSQATHSGLTNLERVVCHCVFKLPQSPEHPARMRWFRMPSTPLSRSISSTAGYQSWGKNWPDERQWQRHIADAVIKELKVDTLIAASEKVYEQKRFKAQSFAEPGLPAFQERSSLEQTDVVLGVSLRALREQYQQGDRGVTQQFIADIRKKAREVRAMLFIDVEGNGTWGDPDLIEHTSELFRIYQELNTELLGSLRQSPTPANKEQFRFIRGWRNQVSEVEDAIKNKLFFRPVDPDVSTDFLQDSALRFSLARILVWKTESFHAASAQVLLRLHKVSQVPVFFVAHDELPGSMSSLKDMHFEWLNETDGSLTCYPYIGRTRGETASPSEANTQWGFVKRLLEMAKNPFDLQEVQTNTNEGAEP
jgi:hypothetical protein